MRTKAEKRHNDWVKAIHKREVDRAIRAANPFQHDWYDNLHQYSKNKIFCSCPLCAAKTSINGPTISDLRKQQSMRDKEDEFVAGEE